MNIREDVAEEAFEEALRRFPDSHDALIFLYYASGLAARDPTPEQLAWAREKLVEQGLM